MINRRGLITGLVSLLAAPAIVRAASLMDLRGVPLVPDIPVRYLEPNEVTMGYVISRERMEAALGVIRGLGLASLRDEDVNRVLTVTEKRWERMQAEAALRLKHVLP